jgi:hypothetical protein
MKYLLLFCIYIGIALMLLEQHLVWAVVLIVLFTYFSGAVWLLPLGLLVDGYFGRVATFPIFTISITLWYVVSTLLRPLLTNTKLSV